MTEAADGQAAAADAAAAAGVSVTPNGSADLDEVSPEELRLAYQQLIKQRDIYHDCEKSLRDSIELRDQETQKLADQQAAVAAEEKALDDREQELNRRETQVRDREQAVRGGLRDEAAQQRADLAAEADRAAKRLRAERDAFAASQEKDRAHQLGLIDAERASLDTWIKQQRAQLDQQRADLLTEREALDSGHAQVRAAKLEVEQHQARLREQERTRTSEELYTLELRLQTEQTHNELAQQKIADLNERLARHELAATELGNRPLASVLDENDRAKRKIAELTDQLANRLSDDSLDRLRMFEEDNRALRQARDELTYEVHQLKAAGLTQRVNAMQLKQLNDTRQQFEAIVASYEGQIDKLQQRLDAVTGERGDPTEPTFPRCVDLDDKPLLHMPSQAVDEVPDLVELTRNLQGAIWKESERAYELADLRSFLGGLAMSRLHLLQGVSGIGKTSLPLAFAKAMSLECDVIEVQAGWRDRQDLFGHYNTFERKFYESKFLMALYQAQLPAYANRPYFVVLDEMNLSRPEQYFADILSALERTDGDPIELVPKAQGRHADGLIDGRSLRVPPNVWFIGTANHDESTVNFADKTYNRAYVLELPEDRPWIDQNPPARVNALSLRALQDAFSKARRDHSRHTRIARALLTKQLIPEVRRLCRIGISPRIIAQLDSYVPVVVAAGKNEPEQALAEAADQFIAMKVLRKIRGRDEIDNDQLRELRELTELHWDDNKELVGKPARCLEVLDNELRSRGDG